MCQYNEISIDEIQQLIGRNLIAFQSIEIFLIDIHLKKGGRGTEDELLKKQKVIKKMSFGDLINDKQVRKLDSKKNLEDESIEIKTPVFSFDLLPDDQYFKQLQKKLNQFSVERNILVHKFQLRFNLKTPQGRADAKLLLNQQYESLEPLKEELRVISQELTIRRKQLLDHFESEEFLTWLEMEILKKY
jgi:hypothetical protein